MKESGGLQDSVRFSGLNLHFTVCPNFNLNKLRSQNYATDFSGEHISQRFLRLMDAILPSNGQISTCIVNFYRVETDPAVSVSSICRTNRTNVSGQKGIKFDYFLFSIGCSPGHHEAIEQKNTAIAINWSGSEECGFHARPAPSTASVSRYMQRPADPVSPSR